MSLKVFSEFLTDIVDYVKYNNKKLILFLLPEKEFNSQTVSK